MPSKQNNPLRVVTGKCRLSYPHLFETHAMEGDNRKSYSASILIPKRELDKWETKKRIDTAIQAAIEKGKSKKWNGRIPSNLWNPLRDGDEERPNDPAYRGCWFLSAKTTPPKKPQLLELTENNVKNEVLDPDELYAGCWCRFVLEFYPFNNKMNGVAVGLIAVMKVADGDRLDGWTDARDDFDDDWEDDDFPF